MLTASKRAIAPPTSDQIITSAVSMNWFNPTLTEFRLGCYSVNPIDSARQRWPYDAGHASRRVKNTVLICSELMDSKTLMLTANANTMYYFGIRSVCLAA
jgi:hypothetical protein